MASDIEEALSFLSNETQINSMWDLEGIEEIGTLLWESSKPELQIYLRIQSMDRDQQTPAHPFLQKTKPPLQPNITGYDLRYGIITLVRCAQINVKRVERFAKGEDHFIVSLKPTMIFIGNTPFANNLLFTSAKYFDSRLAGFFGTPGLEHKLLWGKENRTTREALGNPTCVWTYHDGSTARFLIPDLQLELALGSTMERRFSAKSGYGANSYAAISFISSTPVSIGVFEKAKQRIEQIFSIFSLETFSFQLELFSGMESKICSVWTLGRDTNVFKPPMSHQIMFDFRNSKVFEEVCISWAETQPEIELSRWLFCKALKETDDGLARFVTAAQSLEVLGRVKGPSSNHSNSDFKKALAAVESALQSFDQELLARFIGLLSSSNKSSFKRVLEHMISEAFTATGEPPDPEGVARLAKLINDTRNALVHMTTSKRNKLEDAFSRSNKLSLVVCFWYAVIQAHHIGQKIPECRSFLFNNDTARHGLPNEMLERSSLV